jgi:hypothetical protein
MSSSIRGDGPVKTSKEDLLNRAKLVETIADQLRRINSSEGFVVGIIGPWGSGKTSLINLVLEELRKTSAYTVLEFNPWMFSGADQLVERFFSELAGQLGEKPKKRLKSVAEGFAKYGRLVSPLRYVPMAEPWVTIISKVPEVAGLAKDFLGDEEDSGITKQRRELQDELAKLKQPILVIVDDIDRLTPPEIRDIFKLVRLTANFPQIIYLVAFDRKRVEAALSEKGLSGRDYLEKIIQLPIDIPTVPASALHLQIISELNSVLGDAANIESPQQFTSRRWDSAYQKVIRPLIRNVRDLRRYGAALPGTLQNLEGKVSLIDVLTLESVRIFRPDVFAAIAVNHDALCYAKEEFWDRDLKREKRQQQIETFLQSDKSPESITRDLLEVLFPVAVDRQAGQDASGASVHEWTKDRRVAIGPLLTYYLERVAGSALQGQWIAEQLPELLGNIDEFEAFAETVDPDAWPDAFFSLPTFEDRIPPEATVQVACNLINFVSRLPQRTGLVFESPVRTAFGIAYRLVGRQPNVDDRNAAVREILQCIQELEDKRILLEWVGPGHDAPEHQLISTDLHEQLARELRQEIREAAPDRLAAEQYLYILLNWMSESAAAYEPHASFDITDELGRALLKAAVKVDDFRPRRERNQSSSKKIRWGFLVEHFGTKEAVIQFAQDCQPVDDDEALLEAISLVLQQSDRDEPADER